jgi:hypothetical protein
MYTWMATVLTEVEERRGSLAQRWRNLCQDIFHNQEITYIVVLELHRQRTTRRMHGFNSIRTLLTDLEAAAVCNIAFQRHGKIKTAGWKCLLD